ncbi:DUF4331 domain-containing protein [Ponticaulis sp.]|uniref:DUF4331 domain-containing protein n=1 Tax=Ponticaulis sp. TaxID=2020902 RepID=UPI000B704F81|nr:DUF4331 domain-containing protein [Ponticaulis sp.]MAI90250.1 hypothetical protein [Ponticaulis sp.]OUX99895.1 MAG: hypothetical protein CBB65_07400 [Hyphomonadaceae bacterium TMED5]|tara:strand:+ start:227457 stop:228995 length:1539 start_codon:yes stop_codon:yes gene_type:complete
MRLKLLLITGAAMAAGITAYASSHREAPGITEQPKVDGTDFYMFRSYEPGREDYVTFIANYQPLQAPYGGPNYFTMDPDALYEIHIDTDADAVEDLTFQFDFDNNLSDGTGIALTVGGESVPVPLRAIGNPGSQGTLNETESYELFMVTGDRRTGERVSLGTFSKPFDNAGNKTIPDYPGYASQFVYPVSIPGCSSQGQVFVGQRAEAFAVNLGAIFDLVNLVPIDGDVPLNDNGDTFPGGITQDRANDDLVGQANVTSLAIEIPIDCIDDPDSDSIIGGWTTASLPQAEIEDPSPTYEQTSSYGGAYVQQSRLSAPLVNEVVIGLPDKDLFNAAEPTQDSALATYVTNPTLPALLDILFRDAVNASLGTNIEDLAPSNFPRNDLVAAFLTGIDGLNQPANVVGSEMMRLNMAIPPTARDAQSTFGVAGDDLAGFPNGRRPGDDTVDIALRVVMGALCYPVPIQGEPTDLGLCTPEDAPVGNVPFTDGAPISASELQNSFPYLNDPIPGETG